MEHRGSGSAELFRKHYTGSWLPLLLLVSVIGGFYLLSLREGHHWGDDFAMYILHARNLATGHPYGETGYIYNPKEPHVGPPNYPPGLAILLAPVYKFWGLNLQAMKIIVVLTLLGALVLLYLILPLELPPIWRLLVVALVGFNPSVWVLRDDVLSDLPFLLTVYLSLWLVRVATAGKALKDPASPAPRVVWWVVLAGSFALAYGMRTLGAITIPAFALYDLVRARRIRLFSVVTAGLAGALCLLSTAVFQTGGGYGGLFNLSARWFVSNGLANVKLLRVFWLNGFSSLFSYLVFAISLLLFAVGVWRAARRIAGIFEIFALLYLLVLIPYQVVNYRYLLLAIPLYICYGLFGLRWLMDTMPAARMPLAGAAIAVVAATYGGAYAKADWGPIHEGIGDPEFRGAVDFINRTAAPDTRLIFRKPRLLALLTGRAAGIYPTTESNEQIRHYIHEARIGYIVVGTPPDEAFDIDRTVLARVMASYPDDWKRVYRTEHYQIYEVTAGH